MIGMLSFIVQVLNSLNIDALSLTFNSGSLAATVYLVTRINALSQELNDLKTDVREMRKGRK
jgi:hypothetical protein